MKLLRFELEVGQYKDDTDFAGDFAKKVSWSVGWVFVGCLW